MNIKSIFGLFLIMAMVSCTNTKYEDQSTTITVSIVPQKFFVEQIAGDWLNVNVMVPTGSSPATYEPTPLQMKSLSKSLLYFRIGHIGFEKAWMNKLVSINPNMKVVDTSKELDLIEEEEFGVEHSDGHEHAHVHEGFNPHTWLSPKLVKKQAQTIYKELAIAFPDKAEVMFSNLETFINKVDSTEQIIDQQLKTKSGTSFIVYHPVWTYLAHDYNLNQISIEFNGKEATARKLREIIDFAKTNNIHIIFAQKEFNAAQAQSIANDIDGEVILLNPLEYNWFSIMQEFGMAFGKLDH